MRLNGLYSGSWSFNRTEQQSTVTDEESAPFSQALVTLTRQDYIQLIWNAQYWKAAHQRALARIEQLESAHQLEIAQAALREAALRNELETAHARIRDLQKRVSGRKSEHSSGVNEQPTPDKKQACEQSMSGKPPVTAKNVTLTSKLSPSRTSGFIHYIKNSALFPVSSNAPRLATGLPNIYGNSNGIWHFCSKPP